jgi:hypothetical protein
MVALILPTRLDNSSPTKRLKPYLYFTRIPRQSPGSDPLDSYRSLTAHHLAGDITALGLLWQEARSSDIMPLQFLTSTF